jgi:hypothetical protein
MKVARRASDSIDVHFIDVNMMFLSSVRLNLEPETLPDVSKPSKRERSSRTRFDLRDSSAFKASQQINA